MRQRSDENTLEGSCLITAAKALVAARRFSEAFKNCSREQITDDVAVNVGEAIVTSLELVSQTFMIDA